MTRKKVKLAYITNDSARKATFKKRKKGLMKKVNELSTLCGIDACLIIYSPYDSRPEVWPSTSGAQKVVAEFRRMPEMEQSKKMVNQEGFIRQRIAKCNEQLKKLRKDNREKEMTQVMFDCLTGKGLQNLNMMDLNDLNWLIGQNLKEIYRRIETLQKEAANVGGRGAGTSASAEGIQRVNEEINVMNVNVNSINVHPMGVHAMNSHHSPVLTHGQVNVNMDGMQRQQQTQNWFPDMMNTMNQQDQMQMPFAGEEMDMSHFDDNEQPNIWSNGFFH